MCMMFDLDFWVLVIHVDDEKRNKIFHLQSMKMNHTEVTSYTVF